MLLSTCPRHHRSAPKSTLRSPRPLGAAVLAADCLLGRHGESRCQRLDRSSCRAPVAPHAHSLQAEVWLQECHFMLPSPSSKLHPSRSLIVVHACLQPQVQSANPNQAMPCTRLVFPHRRIQCVDTRASGRALTVSADRAGRGILLVLDNVLSRSIEDQLALLVPLHPVAADSNCLVDLRAIPEGLELPARVRYTHSA